MDHWSRHAQAWTLVGPPLRPSSEDLAIVDELVRGRTGEHLILGVTPELVERVQPPSTVVAVERERAMIEALFAPAPHRRAVVGDWRALPLADGTVDVVLGDGGASALAFPADYAVLAAELARVVRPGGLVVLRLFAAPEAAETLADVAAALDTVGSFDALKWRIAMAIQSPARAVPVAAIREAFDAIVPDRAALAARRGWRREVIDHVDIYRASPAVYSFPTLAEVRAVLASRFDEVACRVPSYELGDRCPTLALVKP